MYHFDVESPAPAVSYLKTGEAGRDDRIVPVSPKILCDFVVISHWRLFSSFGEWI